MSSRPELPISRGVVRCFSGRRRPPTSGSIGLWHGGDDAYRASMEPDQFFVWVRSRDQTHGPFDSVAEVEVALPSLCLDGDEYWVLVIGPEGRGSVVREAVFAS